MYKTLGILNHARACPSFEHGPIARLIGERRADPLSLAELVGSVQAKLDRRHKGRRLQEVTVGPCQHVRTSRVLNFCSRFIRVMSRCWWFVSRILAGFDLVLTIEPGRQLSLTDARHPQLRICLSSSDRLPLRTCPTCISITAPYLSIRRLVA